MDQMREREWFIFTENRAAVVEALEHGECDGVLPAARGFLDGLAEFCLESGVLSALDTFPDPRERRSIPMFFFCNTLVHRSLFQLQRLAPIERTFRRLLDQSTIGKKRRRASASVTPARQRTHSLRVKRS